MRQTSRIQYSFRLSGVFLGTSVFSCVFEILCMPLQRYIDHIKHKKSDEFSKIETFFKLLTYRYLKSFRYKCLFVSESLSVHKVINSSWFVQKHTNYNVLKENFVDFPRYPSRNWILCQVQLCHTRDHNTIAKNVKSHPNSTLKLSVVTQTVALRWSLWKGEWNFSQINHDKFLCKRHEIYQKPRNEHRNQPKSTTMHQ